MQKKRSLSCPSLSKIGHEHLAWSLGAIKAAYCSWLPLRKDSSDRLKAEDKFHQWHACVCVTTINSFEVYDIYSN